MDKYQNRMREWCSHCLGQQLLCVVVMAVVYYLAARVGVFLAFAPTNVSPIWLASGVGFAILSIAGWRWWPSIALGAFAENLQFFMVSQNFAFSELVWTSGCITVGNVAEAMLGCWLLFSLTKTRRFLSSSRDTFYFLGVVLVVCASAAWVGVMALSEAGIVTDSMRFEALLIWWLGDVTGILVIMPLIVFWWHPLPVNVTKHIAVELVVMFTLSMVIVLLVFADYSERQYQTSLSYLLIPLILWSAFRFSQRVNATWTLCIAIVAVLFTWHGDGPFVRETQNISLLLLQLFVSVLAGLSLVIASVVHERRNAQLALLKANEELEQRVLRRTRELEVANQHLIEVDHLKFTFIASLSHELRTPMNAILGFTNILLRQVSGSLNAQQLDQIGRAYSSSKQLMSLLRDVIDLSKLEVGRMDVMVTKFQLKPILLELADDLDYELKAKQLVININCAENIELETDMRRLQQCIGNLTTHAIESSDCGAVGINVRLEDKQIVFIVSDTAKDISEEDIPTLFDAFEGEGANMQFRTGAKGLSLHVARRLAIYLLRGKVAAKWIAGKGTELSLTIPKRLVR